MDTGILEFLLIAGVYVFFSPAVFLILYIIFDRLFVPSSNGRVRKQPARDAGFHSYAGINSYFKKRVVVSRVLD